MRIFHIKPEIAKRTGTGLVLGALGIALATAVLKAVAFEQYLRSGSG